MLRNPSEFAAFERLLAQLSTDLINLSPARIDCAIEHGLRQVIEILDIDRSTLFRMWPETGQLEVMNAVARDGVDPSPRAFSARSQLPYTFALVMTGAPMVFSRLDDLPPRASVDRATFEQFGQKALVAIPMTVAGEVHGVLDFGCTRQERVWSDELLSGLRRLANIVANALARKRSQEELDSALGFERLATSILSSLLSAETQDGAGGVERGLRDIAHFLEVEHVTLWERLHGGNEFCKASRWIAPGLPAPLDRFSVIQAPWISSRLIANQVVNLPRLDDLPTSALTDRRTLESFGVRSQLIVPHRLGATVVGALAVGSVSQERYWPDPLVSGLRLLAEVFSSLNVRRSAERQKRAAEAEAAAWRERLAHLLRVHAVGEMSGALAHEITQPLGAIENYALAARRRISASEPDIAKVSDLLDHIIGQASRAGDVIARLRSMVKRHDLALATLDLERVIGDCVETVRMDCELRDIVIQRDMTPDMPCIVADEIHIQQVVLNLLRNAMEAMDRAASDGPRTIALSTRNAAADGVSVVVADRGTGIPEGDLERVFESFYSSKASGLGIGLAISRKLIEAHGGRLWASHRPGGGAVFEFTLPAGVEGE